VVLGGGGGVPPPPPSVRPLPGHRRADLLAPGGGPGDDTVVTGFRPLRQGAGVAVFLGQDAGSGHGRVAVDEGFG
jgi:hypothetical protein